MYEGIEKLRSPDIMKEMDNRGISVVAHILIEDTHEYNVTKKQLEKMRGELLVLKWERDSLAGPQQKKRMKKKALYQIRT